MAKGAKTPWLAWVAIVVLLLVLLSRTSKASSAPGSSSFTPYAPGSNLPGPYSPDLGPVYGPPAPGAAFTPDHNYVETSPSSAPTSSSNPLNPYAVA